MLFSILCLESPFSSITITDEQTNSIRIIDQEVLLTLQDWLWVKMITIYTYQHIPKKTHALSSSVNPDEFTFEYFQQYILSCDPNIFDNQGTKPFSYIQNLIIVNQYNTAIQYLLNKNLIIPALMISLLLYYYHILGDESDMDNYYYLCLSRVLSQLRNRVDLATYLIAVINDVSVKMNFCIVFE